MKNFIFKISMLVFMLSMLSGIYTGLPFIDNLIRSFVIFVLFFLAIWIIMLVYVQTLAVSHKTKIESSAEMRNEGGEHTVHATNS